MKLEIIGASGEMMVLLMFSDTAAQLLSLLSRGNAGDAWRFGGAAI